MSQAITSPGIVVLALVALSTSAWAQNPGKTKRKPAAERPQEGTLKPGDDAPNFKLKKLHSDEEVELSSFRGQRPVVLVFGSYT